LKFPRDFVLEASKQKAYSKCRGESTTSCRRMRGGQTTCHHNAQINGKKTSLSTRTKRR